MQKLMTKFDFSISNDKGCYITVTRLIDNAIKVFYLVGSRDKIVMTDFMNNITDEQADGYFPKERKKK
jgi:hypothetical protein